MGLKTPKGIRNVSEWYMSTILRIEHVNRMFELQTDIAIANYRKLWERIEIKCGIYVWNGLWYTGFPICSVETLIRFGLPIIGG
ncbi:hypothetical protein MASR1M31_18880 [Porphyromonadaceae bacterium]